MRCLAYKLFRITIAIFRYEWQNKFLSTGWICGVGDGASQNIQTDICVLFKLMYATNKHIIYSFSFKMRSEKKKAFNLFVKLLQKKKKYIAINAQSLIRMNEFKK